VNEYKVTEKCTLQCCTIESEPVLLLGHIVTTMITGVIVGLQHISDYIITKLTLDTVVASVILLSKSDLSSQFL
jgi:hypothetical protein